MNKKIAKFVHYCLPADMIFENKEKDWSDTWTLEIKPNFKKYWNLTSSRDKQIEMNKVYKYLN